MSMEGMPEMLNDSEETKQMNQGNLGAEAMAHAGDHHETEAANFRQWETKTERQASVKEEGITQHEGDAERAESLAGVMYELQSEYTQNKLTAEDVSKLKEIVERALGRKLGN